MNERVTQGGERVLKGAQTYDCMLRPQLCCGHKPTAHLDGPGGMLPQKIW